MTHVRARGDGNVVPAGKGTNPGQLYTVEGKHECLVGCEPSGFPICFCLMQMRESALDWSPRVNV